MKTLLNFLAVLLLNGVFLYPLFFSGTGRQVNWWLVLFMAVAGVVSIYLLVRFRRQL